MLSSFKGKSEAPNQVVFPTAVLFVKNGANSSSSGSTSSSSSTSLSAGAIAGIAVGAAAAAAALAAGAWLLLARRQRTRQQSPEKGAEEAAPADAKLGTGDTWGSAYGLRNGDSAPRNSAGSVILESAGSSSKQPSTRAASLEGAIPELVEHVAAQEASLLTQRTLSTEPSGDWDDGTLLPPHLREWVVDASQIVHLRHPDGSLWQIGSGASSKVYRVECRGEVCLHCAVPLWGRRAASPPSTLAALRAVLPAACRCWLQRKWSWEGASRSGRRL